MSAHITIDDNTRLAHALVVRTPGLPANGHTANGNTPVCGDTLTVARIMSHHDTAPRHSMTLWNAPGVRDAGPTITVEQYLASIAR
jgi:hypothetical protein